MTDAGGKHVAVLVGIERYEQFLEEIETVRAYDEAKASGDEAVPFEQAVVEIEEERRGAA